MKKITYKTPRMKAVELSIRRGVCQDASLIGSAIEIGALDPSTGDIIDL